MKKLLVIHTGGTISMSQDESNKVVTNTDNPISNHQNIIKTNCLTRNPKNREL